MIVEECICSLRAKHLDWCSLAGIVQAIVETFPKNCTLMFPPLPPPAPITMFDSTFKPESSNDKDDDNTFGTSSSFCRFESSLYMPSSGARRGISTLGRSPGYTSTPLPHGSAFILASNPKGVPSSALGMQPANNEEHGSRPVDDDLDMGLEADDEGRTW